MNTIKERMLQLLQQMISIPSFSREEQGTAAAIAALLAEYNIPIRRLGNNVWARNKHFDPAKPVILLNSHHDTVKPNAGYARDPFCPVVEDGRLYGLGSNDAGGALVSLLANFLYFYDKDGLKFNLMFAATAEEEISGHGGVELLLPGLGDIYLGIVGEPTQMQMAIAEKGLLVLDCHVVGEAGHAARNEGDNAIYKAMSDIKWFQAHRFPKTSSVLGEVKMTVTMMQAGIQHNMVPPGCSYTVDIRTTDAYTNEEILDEIKKHVIADVHPRSLRLKPSGINPEHTILKAATNLGIPHFGSPTMSDQALMPFPTVKIGPGDSARSHTADEFIYISELMEGIEKYKCLLIELNELI